MQQREGGGRGTACACAGMVDESPVRVSAGHRSWRKGQGLVEEGLNTRPVYGAVQALRGLAALAVVIHHIGVLWKEQYGLSAPLVLENGAAGVDLFFVISGFVMTISSTGGRSVSAKTFLRRRLLRIAPMYWLMTLLAFAKVWMVEKLPSLGSRGEHLPVTGLDLLRSLLFLPYRNSAGLILPVLQVGWTLNFEMFFYLVFALALLWSKKPLRRLAPVLIVLALAGVARPESWPAVTVLINPLLLEFLGGVFLGWLVQGRRGRGVPGIVWAASGMAGLALLVAGSPGWLAYGRALVWGVPAFLVIQAAVLLDGKLSPRMPASLLRLGDSSYSLYLSHVLVCILVFWTERRLLTEAVVLRMGFWPTALVTTALALAIGLALYGLVEKPMTVALARWTGWNRGRAPLPVSV